mmetsp:Transcript_3629/g.8423  ORF Transcript_3629/g.8423 Transcript_3629/m.8423 type:complete len:265 (-) Transcript_3629:495-1289(-)
MRIRINIVEGVFEVRHLCQDVSSISQALSLEVQEHLLPGVLRILNHLVNEDTLNLKIFESTDVRIGQHRLLRLEPSDDIHPRFLHDGEQVGVVTGPSHVPDIFSLEVQLLARPILLLLRFGRLAEEAVADDLDVEQQEDSVDVNNRHPCAVTVGSYHLGPAADREASFKGQVGQSVAMHDSALPRHKKALLSSTDARDWILCCDGRRNKSFLVMGPTTRCEGFVDVEHHLRSLLLDAHARSRSKVPLRLPGNACPVVPNVDNIL